MSSVHSMRGSCRRRGPDAWQTGMNNERISDGADGAEKAESAIASEGPPANCQSKWTVRPAGGQVDILARDWGIRKVLRRLRVKNQPLAEQGTYKFSMLGCRRVTSIAKYCTCLLVANLESKKRQALASSSLLESMHSITLFSCCSLCKWKGKNHALPAVASS